MYICMRTDIRSHLDSRPVDHQEATRSACGAWPKAGPEVAQAVARQSIRGEHKLHDGMASLKGRSEGREAQFLAAVDSQVASMA